MNRMVILSFLFAAGLCVLGLPRSRPGGGPEAQPISISSRNALRERARLESTSATRTERRRVLVSRASADDRIAQMVEEIQALLASTNFETRDLVFTNHLPALVLLDASAAGRLAETFQAGDLREEILMRVAQDWAALDPQAALAWASSFPAADERQAIVASVCLQLAQTNPVEAVATAERLGLSEAKVPILENLVQQWAAADTAAALAWVSGRSAGEQREKLMARLAFVKSQTAPVEAARLVVEQITPGTVQTEAVISVLHQWGRRDPQGAAAWVELFPQGPLRDRASQELKTVN